MKVPYSGAIDCDVHPVVPNTRALLPYMNDFWQDHLALRHIDRAPFTLASYPPTAPLSARPDWRPETGLPGSDLDLFRKQALDPFGTGIAICNPLHGSMALFNVDMAAAFASAINDWMAKEWLDREPRLRASIVVPVQNPQLAVAEIERVAPDKRFVQVLMLVTADMPLGNRIYWPIYEAAERHGLTIGLHAGTMARQAPTGSGYPSYHVEDYILQGPAFEDTVVSFLAEGVFAKYPKLKLVLMESGFTWLPTLLWRTNKSWRGVRTEVPWIDRPPADIVRDHVRFTLQPLDLPPDSSVLSKTLEHVGSDDLLLFSTDYPHWQFEGEDVLPDGLSDALARKILIDNPLATYPRLADVKPHAAPSATQETVP